MKKNKKILIGIGAVVFIALIVILNLKRENSAETVEIIVAKKENISATVRADGTLKGLNQVEIGSDVTGKIVEMRVKEGDKVNKGDVLCIIDPSTYSSRVKRVYSVLKLSQAKLAKGELDFNRSTVLFESKLISKENYETAKLNYEAILSEVKSNEEIYNEEKSLLDKTTITSPVTGEIVQRNKEEGEMIIAGGMNSPDLVVMTIADRSKMSVKALVDETDIINIAVNQPVKVTVDAFPDTIFDGQVVKIGGMPEQSNLGTEQAINFPIEIEITGISNKLYPGMSATCEITIGKRDSVIVIPYMALGKKKIKEEEKDIVILFKGNKAKTSTVKIGLTGKDGVEIKEGISLNDSVLTAPYKTLRKLKDGDRIKVSTKKKDKKDKDKKAVKEIEIK
ncbi:MAG: efflux RND transporter periplasmic adaptor subunit [bacterium]|nr:efflux RND transporter periplasmic adaptor subunit [bacterium]